MTEIDTNLPEVNLTRRDFLKGAGVGIGSLIVSACTPQVETVKKVINTLAPTAKDALVTPDATPQPVNPIEEISFDELQSKYPDRLANVRSSMKELIPAWKDLPDSALEMDYLVFNSNESGQKKMEGWVMVSSVDNVAFLWIPTNVDGKQGAKVSPLLYAVDADKTLTYFTVENGKQVTFIKSNLQGTEAFLPNGKTYKSDIVLPNPNERKGKLAASIPPGDYLTESVTFDKETGLLTAKNTKGDEVQWNGSEWIVTKEKISFVKLGIDVDNLEKIDFDKTSNIKSGYDIPFQNDVYVTKSYFTAHETDVVQSKGVRGAMMYLSYDHDKELSSQGKLPFRLSFAYTTAPDGNDYLVILQEMSSFGGEIDEMKFLLPMEFIDIFRQSYKSGQFFISPLAYDNNFPCSDLGTFDGVCQLSRSSTKTDTYSLLKQFDSTRIFPDGLSQGFLIPWWEKIE